MKTKINIPKLFIVIALVPIVAISAFYFSRGSFKILETSLLTILRNISEENAPEPPDLSIESVSIKKVSNPTDSFKYYKYTATIILHNHGGHLIDERVLLHGGDDQKHVLVSNTVDGFTLMRDQSYIVRNFEFIFDGRYNGGTFPFEVEVADKTDYYEDNDTYTVDIFEPDAKVESVMIEEILNDGTIVLDFNSIPFSIRKHEFEIYTSDEAAYSEDDLRYDEIYTQDEVYGYYRVKNSLRNVQSYFTSKTTTELESHFVELDENPFLTEENNFAFIKATNPETGSYAISNILLLPPQTPITRAEFAEMLVENTGIEAYDGGVSYFEDVDEGAGYYSAVQTLFNYGLFNTNSTFYEPDNEMSRAEALRIVMDYYDVDLQIAPGAPHFEDVGEEDYIFPYVESLFAGSRGIVFGEYFNSDNAATENYLNYLIDEYSENN
ncbi:MAG: S-layer homology domain-containing protein [Nitrospirota bacterium]